MPYLLDANVFIQAKNLHYGLDFCPAFWDWLVEQNRHEKVFSIEKVGDELIAGADELVTWAGMRGGDFFLKPDAMILTALSQVSEWVNNQQYDPAAVYTFLQIADYYLISHALSHKYVVVTHEIASDGKKRVKIPNVCIGLEIKCMTPFEMLRIEKARFVLGSQVANFTK